LGRSFPLTFATHRINDLDTIVAMSLFFNRALAIHPAMPGFVASVDLTHRRGPTMFAHIDADLGRFLIRLRHLFDGSISRRELGERIAKAVEWIGAFLDG